MSTSDRTFTPGLGRGLRAVALTAAATVGAISIAAGPASAHHPDQSVEVIVPQISTHAVEAMDALARFEAGDIAALKTYQQQRAYAAILTAHHLGYSEQEMVRAWSTTPIDHQRAVLAALTQLGVPYRRVSSIEGVGFDCSGLTSYAWRSAGHELFRNSSAQISAAARVDRSEAKAGDLVQYPGHIMMYLGVEDAIVHSIQTGRDVEIDHLSQRKRNSVRFGDPTG